MQKRAIVALAAIVLLGGFAVNVKAQVSVGLSADESGIKEFYLSVGQYYHTPEKEVLIVKERGLPDDDIPVVFFLAQRARVSPQAIIDLRLSGKSWMDITLHYGFSPEIYYMKVREVTGPPYGKALGYYRNRPRKEWKEIRLGDDDVVNLVNLRFISKQYGYSPDKVIAMRSSGATFIQINSDIKKGKESKNKEGGGKSHKDKQGGKGHGKGKK